MHSGRIVFPAGAVGSWRPSGVDLQPYRTTTDGAPHYRLQPINDHDEDLFHFDDENNQFFSRWWWWSVLNSQVNECFIRANFMSSFSFWSKFGR